MPGKKGGYIMTDMSKSYEVSAVIPLNKKKSKITFTDGSCLPLYSNEIKRFGIVEGCIISDNYYLEIFDILRKRARERCFYLLKDGDKTIKQIKDKLKQCFYPEEIIEETISFLCKYNYLNDERYCVNYINSKKSVKSIRQITAELYNKGISPEFVKNILQNEEYDISLDSSECIYKLLKKKSFDSKNEDYSYKSKILAYVVSKGFDFDDVISVMSKFDRYD